MNNPESGFEIQNDVIIQDSRDVNPADIQELRESVGWLPDETEIWQQTLQDALAVKSAYEDSKLIGIGFLVGSPRHAVVCDVCVDPNSQNKGIGQSIVESLIDTAKEKNIRFVTLTFNEKNPWLQNFYTKLGFKTIQNAMQLDTLET